MASIPLTGQIRLGNHFNDQFNYGASLTAQRRMGEDAMAVNYSNGAITNGQSYSGYTTDTIPLGATAQRSLGQYRGGTGTYPTGQTSSGTTANTSQTIALSGEGGYTLNPYQIVDWTGGSIPYTNTSADAHHVIQNVASSNGSSNGAVNMVHDIGYCEPGNYRFAVNGASYNTGWWYGIVRGYASPHLTGANTNYVYLNTSCSWAGGWANANLGTLQTDFTVNSTYPYLIISLETHCNNAYYLTTAVNRKNSVTPKGSAAGVVCPNVWRIS